ncbi:MAG: methyltransferase domain-containing protein [Planctomycetota bacterium]
MKSRFSPLLVAVAVLAASGASSADRGAALRALSERLGVGPGGVVADVGCGSGHDSFVFAGVVGETGVVLAEEISADQLKAVLEGSRERKLGQVVPVLGDASDPHLPNGRADLIYLHFVFHHLSDPRSMLRSMWLDLRPGGHLAIVDRARGPLRDPVPLEKREREHHWTGETAVVRLAREAGFEFADAPDDLWPEKEEFLVIFRRPSGPAEPGRDPDAPGALGPEALDALPLLGEVEGDAAVFALDAGRALLPGLRERLGPSRRAFDVVLEEWVVAEGDVPERGGEGFEILRAEGGSVALPDGTKLAAAIFADAYHRLWDPAALLGRLRGALVPGGRVAILDRPGPEGEPRRLAGHHRRISPGLVREELARAGFALAGERADVAGRFLLVFEAGEPPKAPSEPASLERQF